jgi:antitoxin VapB
MRTASLFKNGKNQAVRLPKDFEFEGITEVEIEKSGESIIITPKRKSWLSFIDVEKIDEDFPIEREDVIEDGRIIF